MTKLLFSGLLALASLSGFATRVSAQEAPPASLEVWEHPPLADEGPLDETGRRLRRYKRMRIAGGTLIGLSVVSFVVTTAVVAAGYECNPQEELCGLTSPSFVATIVAVSVSPAIVAGLITLGIGTRRARRLRLEAPRIAANRHGIGVALLGRF